MASLYLRLRSFRGLQNYTTLKRPNEIEQGVQSFRGLQNYTTLKRL